MMQYIVEPWEALALREMSRVLVKWLHDKEARDKANKPMTLPNGKVFVPKSDVKDLKSMFMRMGKTKKSGGQLKN